MVSVMNSPLKSRAYGRMTVLLAPALAHIKCALFDETDFLYKPGR